MTYLEELQSYISDAHKDAYGFRPRGEAFWAGLQTVEAASAEADRLSATIGEQIAEEQAFELEVERKATEHFELQAAGGRFGEYEDMTDAWA